jgi:hypothetical protein
MRSDFTDFEYLIDSYPPERWLSRHYVMDIVVEKSNAQHTKHSTDSPTKGIPVQGTEDESMS